MEPGLLAERMGLPGTDGEKVAILRENAKTLQEMRSMLAIFDSADVEEEAVSFLSSLRDSSQIPALLRRIAEGDYDDFERLFKELEKGSTLSKRELFMLLRISDHRQEERPAPERTLPVDPERVVYLRE